jgi:hypothetical protein
MGFIVSLKDGNHVIEDASNVLISDGHLGVYNRASETLALYAPGEWRHAQRDGKVVDRSGSGGHRDPRTIAD